MNNEINKVINRLSGFLDKIYCSPLTEEELSLLENKINIQFPDFYKTFLLKIGMFQDLIRGGIFETEGQYVFEKEILKTILKNESNDYFAFGNNGYGDLYVLKDGKFDDAYIYKLNHESGKITRTKETFIEYLNKAIDKAIKEYKKRKSNDEKKWSIQLSFETNDEKELYDIFQKNNIIQADDKWEISERFPSGVVEYKKSLLFGEEKIILKKSEYKEWDKPNYSLNMSVILTDKKGKDKIEKIDLFFRRTKDLGYKLISYGIN